MRIDSARIASVKAWLKIDESLARNTEKCPLSVLTGVRNKPVNSKENIWTFISSGKRNCPYKRVSVDQDSTVMLSSSTI